MRLTQANKRNLLFPFTYSLLPYLPPEGTGGVGYLPITVILANFKSSCLVPAFWKSTVALAEAPSPERAVTTPTPKRLCSILSPTESVGMLAGAPELRFAEEDDDEDENEEGESIVLLPRSIPLRFAPTDNASRTLRRLPPRASSSRSKAGLNGLTGVSAFLPSVIFGFGSAINCEATGWEFCILPLEHLEDEEEP